jgi:hypothetical protein
MRAEYAGTNYWRNSGVSRRKRRGPRGSEEIWMTSLKDVWEKD